MEGRSGGWIEVNGEGILGKKLVDKSIFRHGTTIPKDEAHKYFNTINREYLQRGENEVVTILVDGKEFKALFRNVKSDKRDDTYQFLFRKEIKNYIKENLPKSYKYIFKYKENPNIEKPQEYIGFYKTDKLNTFRVELITDDNYSFKELPNEDENITKETVAAASENNKALKEEFFKYIGDKEENINRKYQKTYKIVLLIALLELADFEGKAIYEDVCSYIKEIYIERHKEGLAVETFDSEIQKSIKNLEINTVKKVMNENPYNVISEKDYIFKEYVDEVEYLSFNTELWDELIEEDKEELKDILKYKLNNYYLEKNLGENMDPRKYYLYNTVCENPNVWQHCLEHECAAISYIQNLDTAGTITRVINVAKQIRIGDKIIAYAKPQQILAVGEVIKTYYEEMDKSKFVYNGVNMDKAKECRTYNQRIGVRWTSVLSHPLYVDKFDKSIEQKNTLEKANSAFGELTKKGFNDAEKLINSILLKNDSRHEGVVNDVTADPEETDKLEEAISEKISILEESNFQSKDVIDYIYNYIAAKGYEYSRDIIKNLYLSLKTKPFVILYGISGTGKSKLVELFAEAIGASREDGTYNLIPVRPDWSDASELIGYRNIEGKFQLGILTNIIKKAIKHKEIPYFVCLDEMNLARVEYYFSDILSIMETRDKIDEEVKTDKLIRKELFAGDLEAVERFEALYIPENLYIIGTVNMDETTFPFSKKVLDRANTIEFNEVDLDFDFDRDENVEAAKIYSNELLCSEYIKIAQCREKKDTAKEVIDELKTINWILEECDMQFAYRVRDEVVFYVIYAVNEEIMDFQKALDYAIKQKILPRIGGSSGEIEKCLLKLFILFSNMNKSNFASDYIDEDTLDKMFKYLKEDKKELKEGSKEKSSCRYPISSEKILKMLWRFNRDGFTTFW
ncbi:McrB family protein [Clostridium magnum]|uniref:5-methylcytosine-specific restriction enzyme B n=1 Tax=Clostridium magnum DSM 2767 TaxID=1121326 RepID=A0A162QJD0_9CLOT|nr:AAA family ATPase [Clostridium magnum]KZL88595.1 5-methylcytosine-specific restriction enzyme B [Clostridium magnum DSM 2767]SHI84088.1 AAA domain (dynein-related subfamily) [Clostridium magnum DSM 2767]